MISHFDNIPDTLFKSGKPNSSNTNKANSQRCTILTGYPSNEFSVLSTPLQRWNTADRNNFLSRSPNFHDVTAYNRDHQFLRPLSREIARYLQLKNYKYTLGDLVVQNGRYRVHIGSVARNFIAIRNAGGSGVNTFQVESQEDFFRFLGLVVSDVFFDYWRSVGDGFHVTRTNVTEFPISDTLDEAITLSMPEIRRLWQSRHNYLKSKRNSGSLVHSYDFSNAAPFIRFWLGNKLTD